MRKMQGGECDNNGRRGTQRTVLARYTEIDIYVVIFNFRILTSVNAILDKVVDVNIGTCREG